MAIYRIGVAACLCLAAAVAAPVWAAPGDPEPIAPVIAPVVEPMSAVALALAILDELDDDCLAEADALAAIAGVTEGQDIDTIVDALQMVSHTTEICESAQAAVRSAYGAAQLAQAASQPTAAGFESTTNPLSAVGVPGGAGGASYLG